MGTYYYVRFAQAYGEGTYSNCNYNDSTSCSTSGGGSTGGNNSSSGSGGAAGNLSNTGLMIALVVTIACLIAFVALIVRFWRRPTKKELLAETVPADDNRDHPAHD